MLKTYITKIENINKYQVSKYLKYLLSNTHENHIGRTEIFNNSVDPKLFFMNNASKIRINNQLQKRGRALKVSNKSLTFNIPKSYHVTKKDMIEIQSKLLNSILEYYKERNYNISGSEIFSNIHLQQNNHINFIIPILNHKTYKSMRFLKDRKFHSDMAKTFTKIVDNHLGTYIGNYNIENETIAFIEEEENKNYTLEELSILKDKYKGRKLIKRFYDYIYRIKAKELQQIEDSKTIDRLITTYTKILEDKDITQEEAKSLRKVLKGVELRKTLSKEQNSKLNTLSIK